MKKAQKDAPIITANVGERISQLRRECGWTQKELAEILNLDRRVISSLEHGTRNLDIKTLFAMSQLFGVSTDYIAGTSPQRVMRCGAITNKLDLNKLNDLGLHLMYSLYHILLNNPAFCKDENQI